ncbi:hypothetical protein ACPW96_05740 [Micromonospora sp. DT81.3]|uniref:hypothetical protein n=1 Tax=Actinomycetes TaxID=1760 RepID=UPI003CF4F25B
MTSDAEGTGPVGQRVSLVRRVIVGVIVVSFALAAVGGIAVLLGGDFGPTAGRVLGTTAVVGAYSVAVLCCAALAGRRLQVFGTIGAAVSVATAALTIVLIWWDFGQPPPDGLWRVLWSGVTITAALALGSLLLLLSNRRRPAVRAGLWITLGLFGVVVAMVLYLIWFPADIDDDVFPRALGILGILAALGAVVVPVLSLLFREPGSAERPAAPAAESNGISSDAAARLRAEASRRGVTVDALVTALLGDGRDGSADRAP